MQELLLVLLVACLPIAVWTGYLLGKRKQTRDSTHLPDQYFAGLNYLLNEQPDKAIDVFIEQLQQNNEVVETHLALGNLFRRRGEVDRAIRIHQNLIARPSLSTDIRKLALFELAHDYLAAGLYDRAENLFTELLSDPYHKPQALKNLVLVHQQLKDWQQAIDATLNYVKLTGKKQTKRLANYHCQIAEEAFDSGDLNTAMVSLKKAFQIEPKGLRASLLMAKYHLNQSHYKKSLNIYREVATNHPGYLSEFIQDMHRCHIQLGTEKLFHQELQNYLQTSHNLDALILYRNLSRGSKTADHMLEILEDFSIGTPTIQAISYLVSNYRDHAKEPDRSQYDKLLRVLDSMSETEHNYLCK